LIARLSAVGPAETTARGNALIRATGGLPRGGPARQPSHTTLGSDSFTRLTSSNIRQVQIVGGQLYASSDKKGTGISTVGAGVPTASGQKSANLPGSPEAGGDPYAFALLSLAGGTSPDTLYAADGDAGKINKFSLANGVWKAEGSKSVSHVSGLAALSSTAGPCSSPPAADPPAPVAP
jgi:hypothetical protein